MSATPADLARAALRAHRFAEADAILRDAEIRNPHDPDVVCERAILDLVHAHEERALGALPRASGALRERHLARLLCEHWFCRTLLEPHDDEARRIFASLRERCGEPLEGVGVRLSACIIVRDEEENLDRCLRSLDGVVDEIVVVDTGSTDRTVEIARAYGAITGRFEWRDDFAAARNHALELAGGQWALWIDADEELAPESASAIRRALVRPQFGGFEIEIVNPTEEGEAFVHSAVRLFRRIPGVRFEGRVHEQIAPSLRELGLPLARLEGARILHFGYRPEVMRARGKVERTVGMLEREVRERPGDPFAWFNLANALLVGGRAAEAEHAAARCVPLLPGDVPYGRLAFSVLAQAATALGRYDAALRACDEADASGFGGIQSEFDRANALLLAGRPEEALAAAERCMSHAWPAGVPGDRGIETHKRQTLRGRILALLGRHSEALSALDEALAAKPDYAQAQLSRCEVLATLGRTDEAVAALAAAGENPSVRARALAAIGRIHAARSRWIEAATAFEEAWRSAPEDEEAWRAWHGACERAGETDAVLRAFAAFAEIQSPTSGFLIDWGRALAAAGDSQSALAAFVEAIRLAPTDANGYFNCGDLLYDMGMVHDAAHLYEAGLRHAPDSAEGWFTLANCMAKLGLAEVAIRTYEQTLALDPAHSKARHNLSAVREAA